MRRTTISHWIVEGDQKDQRDSLHTKPDHHFFGRVDRKGRECINGKDLLEWDLLLAETGLNPALRLYMTYQ